LEVYFREWSRTPKYAFIFETTKQDVYRLSLSLQEEKPQLYYYTIKSGKIMWDEHAIEISEELIMAIEKFLKLEAFI